MLFADGTMLYFVRTSLKEIVDNTSRNLETIFSYLCSNDFILNIKEFKYMIICNGCENVDSKTFKVEIDVVALETPQWIQL